MSSTDPGPGPGPGPKNSGPGPEVRVQGQQNCPNLTWTGPWTVYLKLKFCHSPPLLVFSISQSSIHIDTTFKLEISIENSDHVYTLAAVIYYAKPHLYCTNYYAQ